jgi:biopolymer transport protein ExbD
MIRLTAKKRPTPDSIVPMINVAFLLLIFFLMSAVLTPQTTQVLDLADARGQPVTPTELLLSLDKDGILSVGIEGSPLERASGKNVKLYVDRETPAKMLATTLSQIEAAGALSILLIARNP